MLASWHRVIAGRDVKLGEASLVLGDKNINSYGKRGGRKAMAELQVTGHRNRDDSGLPTHRLSGCVTCHIVR